MWNENDLESVRLAYLQGHISRQQAQEYARAIFARMAQWIAPENRLAWLNTTEAFLQMFDRVDSARALYARFPSKNTMIIIGSAL